ncbi:hypothetical protein GCM10023147_12730 [Tsukamurella soli]|uniref:Uncharacterized protein n=1 Tax=Tsukamurella soli TaxID=644556 RepID=A0ABP8JAP3_9ACTN
MRQRRYAATVAVLGTIGALLAGCGTTVTGTGIADPSSLAAMLDTGAYAKTKRVIESPTAAQGRLLELRRMLEVMPLASDSDPSIKYSNSVDSVSTDSLRLAYGSGIGTALSGMQFGVAVDARAQLPSRSSVTGGEFVTTLVRMASDSDAASAVASPQVMAADEPLFGTASPPKVPTDVGVPGAKAYTQTFSDSPPATIALLAHGRFVIAVYARRVRDGAVRSFLQQQVKALDGFTPTPDDELASLPADKDGIAALTLAPSRITVNTYGWSTPRGLLASMTDMTTGQKDFDDAGVDLIGLGANNVYRARDAAGAKLLADRYIAESKQYYPGGTVFTVQGVPDSSCYPLETALVTLYYCVVPVGRYLSEFSGPQRDDAQQATAAAYLILEGEK